jgi:hypothetical protein
MLAVVNLAIRRNSKQMHKLDQEILRWIAQLTDSNELKAQIDSANVIKRDYMRTGYFIYFAVAPETPLVDKSLSLVSPDILSTELLDGAGTTLFLRNGKIHYLEIYARGGFFPEALESYSLAMPS